MMLIMLLKYFECLATKWFCNLSSTLTPRFNNPANIDLRRKRITFLFRRFKLQNKLYTDYVLAFAL